MELGTNDKESLNTVFEMPLFLNLDSSEKSEISKILHFFLAKPSERLIEKNRIYFITQGRIESRFPYDSKNTQIFTAGEMINVMAIYNIDYFSDSLISLDNTAGYYMDLEEFKKLEVQKSNIAFNILRNFLKNMSRELRKINDSIIDAMEPTQSFEKSKNVLKRESLVLSETVLESIRNLPFFKKFTDSEFKQLMFDMKKWEIPSGNVLFSEGEQATSCFILVKGKVEVSINHLGRRARLAIFEPGSLFGEIALIHLGLRSATCTALEDIVVLELTRRDFERVTSMYSLLSYKLLEAIAQGLISEYIHAVPQVKKN